MSDEPQHKLNLLVAYPYLKPEVVRLIREHEHDLRFVLDSGAFTAWKAGKPIKLDDYCRFLETLPFKPWRYFTLDVIGDAHGTMKNYETMLARGFKPVPIFTRGEDPAVLDDYYKTSDVVGIGGLVGTEGNKGFVKGIMRKLNGRKAHLLGFTKMSYLKAFKPYMCDSSTWNAGRKFGIVPLYLGRGNLVMFNRKAAGEQLKEFKFKNAIERLGFKPSDFLVESAWRKKDALANYLGAASMVALSKDVRKFLGTHLFMACANEFEVQQLIRAHKKGLQ